MNFRPEQQHLPLRNTVQLSETNPKKPVGTKEYKGWGFGYEQSRYEVSSGLTSRKKQWKLFFVPKTEPFKYIFELPVNILALQKFEVGSSKRVVPE